MVTSVSLSRGQAWESPFLPAANRCRCTDDKARAGEACCRVTAMHVQGKGRVTVCGREGLWWKPLPSSPKHGGEGWEGGEMGPSHRLLYSR